MMESPFKNGLMGQVVSFISWMSGTSASSQLLNLWKAWKTGRVWNTTHGENILRYPKGSVLSLSRSLSLSLSLSPSLFIGKESTKGNKGRRGWRTERRGKGKKHRRLESFISQHIHFQKRLKDLTRRVQWGCPWTVTFICFLISCLASGQKNEFVFSTL